MVNTLTLEMLDDGCVVITLQSGISVLRAAAQSIDALNDSPLFSQFRMLTSDPQVTLSRMQGMAAEMSLARVNPRFGVASKVDAPAQAVDHVVN